MPRSLLSSKKKKVVEEEEEVEEEDTSLIPTRKKRTTKRTTMSDLVLLNKLCKEVGCQSRFRTYSCTSKGEYSTNHGFY